MVTLPTGSRACKLLLLLMLERLSIQFAEFSTVPFSTIPARAFWIYVTPRISINEHEYCIIRTLSRLSQQSSVYIASPFGLLKLNSKDQLVPTVYYTK